MFQFGVELEKIESVSVKSLYDALQKLPKDQLEKELPLIPNSELSECDRIYLKMGLTFEEKDIYI